MSEENKNVPEEANTNQEALPEDTAINQPAEKLATSTQEEALPETTDEIVDANIQDKPAEAVVADNNENVADADAATPAATEEKTEGEQLEETPEETPEHTEKVGTAVVNSEGLIKTVFTEEDHGADHEAKANEYAAQGGYQTQPWKG